MRKKLTAILLAVLMVMVHVPICVYANEVPEGSIYWYTKDYETKLELHLSGSKPSASEYVSGQHFMTLTKENIPWGSEEIKYKISKVIIEDDIYPSSTAYLFYDLRHVSEIVNIGKIHTENVTDMNHMFYYCMTLKTLDLSKFNTSNVTDMSSMFENCQELGTLNLSSFNTSNVTNMSNMFNNCKKMTSLNLSSFNTSNVTDMSSMFYNCQKMSSLDLSKFDTSNVTDMSYMFYGCKTLTTLDLSNFNTSKVTDMSGMFCSCEKMASIGLSSFNTSKVTDMSDMFNDCEELTSLNLSEFNTNNVTDMSYMFSNCFALISLDLSSFNKNKVTDMSNMFASCMALTSLDLSNFNTSKVTDMSNMFNTCVALLSLDLSEFNTSNVTDMSTMFGDCVALTTLDISNFNTSKVTDMPGMFSGCWALTTLDLSSFNTSNVTDMSYMFCDCFELTTIEANERFDTSSVSDSVDMFSGCDELKGGNGTQYDEDYTDKGYARVDETGKPGYFTYRGPKISSILATVEGGFPTSSETGWINENGAKAYINDAVFTVSSNFSLDSVVQKDGDNYIHIDGNRKCTFIMSSGVLTGIIAEGIPSLGINANGTYLPPITPTVSLTGWTYGDDPNTPSVTGNTGNGTVTYKYKVKDAADTTYSTDVPTKAGIYVVKAEIAATTEYAAASATSEFTISKKAVIITAKNKSAYIGELAPQLGENDYTITGLVGGDSLTTTPTLTYEVTPDMTKAGTVVIKASDADAGSNYEISYINGTLTISSRPYSGGDSGSSTVTVPVSGNENSVKVSATISGSTAIVRQIKDTDLEKVTAGESVSIDLSETGKNVDTAKIPTQTVEKIAKKSSLTVKLPVATVEFDKAATEEIADQAKGGNIELVVDDIKEVSLNAVQKEAVKKLDTAIIIDAHLASNGSRLCTADNGGFGSGKAKVILPYEIENNRKPENYNVFYVDEAGNRQKLNATYDEEIKAFVFEIEHFSVYAVAFDQFVDIDANAYYYDAVKWAVANGVTDGVDATHFNPSGITNRAQMVTFLWKVAGKPEPTITETPFADLDPDWYYYKAVLWAYENGITDGTSETTFEPNAKVSRAQVVTFLWRYAGKPVVNYFMQMTDVPSEMYYTEAVRWALSEKITDGTSNTTFSPNNDCLRGQIVTFLFRDFAK